MGALEKNQKSWSQLSEFLCGFAAGCNNICITFPLNKLIFRQMLHGLPVSKAVAELQKEGMFLLYRGILPPLCQKAASISIMFGCYNYYYSKLSVQNFPKVSNQLLRSSSAGLAGLSEAVLTPFERVQTLLQDRHYNSKFTNSMHATKYIWRHHGVREFYRGFSMIVIRNSTANVIFFAAREKAQSYFPRNNTSLSIYFFNFISGGLIGAMISTTFYPVNLVKTRMQTQLGGPFLQPYHVFTLIYNERGQQVKELFRGVHLNYTRSILSWGIINATYELCKYLLRPDSTS